MTALLASVALSACAPNGAQVASEPRERTPRRAEPALGSPPERRPAEVEARAPRAAKAPDVGGAEPTSPAGAAQVDCGAETVAHGGAPVVSRRLRRYASSEYETEALFENASVQRVGDRLRVRWWMEERGCPFTTEIVRAGDLVILRESSDPEARCAPVGATLVETHIPSRASDRRLCLPGHAAPIDLQDLARWSAAPIRPARRRAGLPDPWALPSAQ